MLLSKDLPVDISETFKAGVHLALFGLTVAASLYNLAEAIQRPREKHLKVNVFTYVSLALYEIVQINRHIDVNKA